MNRLRARRPSPSLVISIIALFVAMGGTGYAASQLGKNTVGARQIKTGAVGSSEVKNKALKTADFSPATISALRGKTGAAGATGAQGLKGAKGDKGDTGPTYTAFGQNTTSGAALPGDGVVSDLVGSNGTTGSGALTLPTQSRIFISGHADLVNTSATEPVRARCTPRVSDAGATALPNDAGPNSFADIHQNDVDSSAGPQLHTNLPVTGTALVPAGTYNVGIVCVGVGIGTGTINRFGAALNVFAVPASS